MKRLAILLAIFATCASPAPAAQNAPSEAQWHRAEAIARRTWPNACEHVTTRWGPLQGDLAGLSSWAFTPDTEHDSRHWQRCTVTINSRPPAGWTWTWTRFCSVMVHEFGHLADQQHSRNRRSVMYPVYQGPFWRCR